MSNSARVKRTLALLVYYLVAQHLPDMNFPGGKMFRRIRFWLCGAFFAELGDGVNIESHVFVADGRYLRIGGGSGLGHGCRIYGATIGEDVMIAPNVLLLKDNHNFGDLDRPILAQGRGTQKPPVIEDWAWIGERAIVLPGRRVGRGAIVGAGSVVTKDVEPFEVVAGNPARRIGQRDRAPRVVARS
jgi:maltose O-acetyltransferase